jgi:hypothetical protein
MGVLLPSPQCERDLARLDRSQRKVTKIKEGLKRKLRKRDQKSQRY